MSTEETGTSEATTQPGKSKKRGNFFAVDLPTFHAVCALGDPDAVASYLILAAGTGADNRTSTWSREAINERTSLNWRRARDCVDKLANAGFVDWTKRGARPRLDLRPLDGRAPLSAMAAEMVKLVESGGQPVGQSQKAAAGRARELGYLVKDSGGSYAVAPPRKLQMVWMPKALVDGADGERPPVERVRRARDAMAFRLLVDLYANQDLAELGGVDRRWLQRKFKRETARATGCYQLWTFTYDNESVTWGGPFDIHKREPTPEEKKEGKNPAVDFFERLHILKDAGLIEWVYYLAEDDTDTSMLIHPIAVDRQGGVDWQAFETILGGYAIRAAVALYDEDGADQETLSAYYERWCTSKVLLPAERLLRKVQLFGVPRLRYRAKTSNAARWLEQLHVEGRGYIESYREIIMEGRPELLGTADARLADFNVTSMLVQRRLQRGVQRDINDTSQSPSHASVPSGTGNANGVWPSDWTDRAANEW